jgi:hypothetical protein
MASSDTSFAISDGHLISDAQLVKAGHRILCIAFAMYEWTRLRRDDDPDPLDKLLEFEEEELTEELLKLSALARANDDRLKILDHATKAFPDGVGTITSKGETKSLSAREACNKIIHARKVRMDFAESDKNPIWENWYRFQGHAVRDNFKVPALLLDGTHFNGVRWKARVELVQFVYAVALKDISHWSIAPKKKARRSKNRK